MDNNTYTSASIVEGIDIANVYNATHPRDNQVPPLNVMYRYPDVIYGNIHIAKTGGTSINGILANNFERVCGHKGYSYDAYQANERFKEKPHSILKGYSRDRVKPNIMNEIGFDDCDFISHELPWQFWLQFNQFHNTSMELHLPCRDPIDHLMSQCNYVHKSLNCKNVSDEALVHSIDACIIEMNRFDYKLNELKNIRLKCYDFRHQFTTYMDYMSDKLQPRRFVSDYKQRETNSPRVKENECIWKDKDFMQRVESYLIKNWSYYRFCKQCLGGENEITIK